MRRSRACPGLADGQDVVDLPQQEAAPAPDSSSRRTVERSAGPEPQSAAGTAGHQGCRCTASTGSDLHAFCMTTGRCSSAEDRGVDSHDSDGPGAVQIGPCSSRIDRPVESEHRSFSVPHDEPLSSSSREGVWRMSSLVTYEDGDAVSGCDRADGRRVEPGVADAAAGAGRGAQRGDVRSRRRRVRAAVELRRPGGDPGHRPVRRQRAALHQHAHHRAVLAVAGGHPDRAEPPFARFGHDRGDVDRLPGLQRDPAVRQGHAERDAAAAWLQHVPGRQVAPVAAGARDGGRAVRPLAARPGVRAVLRLPRRRHQPVVSRAGLRQPLGRAAGAARGRLPPERRPGRQGDRVHPGRARQRAGQAVLPALLHRRRRTRRTTSPRSGPTSTRASSTPAGTSTARWSTSASSRWASSRPGTELSAHDPDVPEWDTLPEDARKVLRADDGGVRRVRQLHRPRVRPGGQLPGGDRTSSTTRCSCSSPTTAPAPRADRSGR